MNTAPDNPTPLPLSNTRVLDLSIVWAGPYATQLLADWGAEVIRIEPLSVFQPVTRGVVPRPKKGQFLSAHKFPDNDPEPRPWNRDSAFNTHARNKLSMSLNLDNQEGIRVFEHLVSISDVLLENNPVSTLAKLGIDYPWVRNIRPDIIVVRMPPYGLQGPYRHFRSVGSSLEAVMGHTSIRGYRDTDPSMTSTVYSADAAAGANAAFAAVSALLFRQDSGLGGLFEVGQAQAMLPYLGEALVDYSMNSRVQSSLANADYSKAPHGCYPCAGGDNWITLSIASDGQWQTLCELIDSPALSNDSRFNTILGRWRLQEEIDSHITRWTRDKDTNDLMILLQHSGIPSGPVMKESHLLADPHLSDRGFFQTLHHSETGLYRYPGPMWRSQSFPNQLRTPPCNLGEHNNYVYRDLLGYDNDRYSQLESAGHIGAEFHPNVS